MPGCSAGDLTSISSPTSGCSVNRSRPPAAGVELGEPRGVEERHVRIELPRVDGQQVVLDVGGAAQGGVVQHDDLTVGRQLDVDLDQRGAHVDAQVDGGKGVLRGIGGRAAVGDDGGVTDGFRPVGGNGNDPGEEGQGEQGKE